MKNLTSWNLFLFHMGMFFISRGTRFQYTYFKDEHDVVTQSLARSGGKKNYQPSSEHGGKKIFESIRDLDHEGMNKIEQGDHGAFCKYLSQTKNTICGRHPIGVLMAALQALDASSSSSRKETTRHHRIQFVHYAQSSEVLTTSDSSVSYASAFVQQCAASEQ